MRIGEHVFRVSAVIDGVKIEPGPIKASEASKLEAWTGASLREWELSVANADPLACRALLGLMEFRKGNHVRIDDIDIDDVDGITADLRDEHGRVLGVKQDDATGEPVLRKGKPVWLADEEELDPSVAAHQIG